MYKINKLIGFFSRVLMLVQLQVQHSTVVSLCTQNLGARRPFSGGVVGRGLLPQKLENRKWPSHGGWTSWGSCQLGTVPRRSASASLCRSCLRIPRRTPTTSPGFTDSSWGIFLPASQLKSPLNLPRNLSSSSVLTPSMEPQPQEFDLCPQKFYQI